MSGDNTPKLITYPSREISALPTIQGYLINFSSVPHQPVVPHCLQYPVEQMHLISEEVTALLQKGGNREIEL